MKTCPICHVVAGPNGSGKSTFALDYLPEYAGSIEYVNPDLMAKGLSPIDIRLSSLKSGRLTLKRITELIAAGETFGFETTLSGRGHLKLFADAKKAGYAIHLYYLWMPEKFVLTSRIRHRVLSGGHDVPSEDVFRRYARSVANLGAYAKLSDKLYVFDAIENPQRMIFVRNGNENVCDEKRVIQMRKELGV